MNTQKDMNYEMIDESEVPEKSTKSSKYKKLFEGIPKGKAVVINEEQANLLGVRQALRSMQRRGKFRNIKATQRTTNGKVTLYIINSVEPPS